MKTSSWLQLLALCWLPLSSIAAPGSKIWDFEAQPRFFVDPFTGETLRLTAYIFTSPAIAADGSIYFGAGNGNLYALNPDGSFQWSYSAHAEVQSSPALGEDGTIYFGSVDGNLYALKPDGTLRWSFSTGDYILSSPAIGKDGVIYIGSRDHYLYAVNPDGTQKWRFETGRQVDSAPAIGKDGTIYLGSADWQIYALDPSGTEKWRFAYGSGPAGGSGAGISVGADGTVYVCTAGDDNTLYARSPEDGHPLWSFAFGPLTAYVHPTVPVIGPDGTLYLGTPDRKFYAINPDGTQRWAVSTGTAGHSTAVLGQDGMIYVNTWDQKFLALNPDGSLAWQFEMTGQAAGGLFTATPTLTADKVLYLGSGNGLFYAIQASEGFANSPWPTFNRNNRHTADASSTLVRPPQLKIQSANAETGLTLKFRGENGVRFTLEYTGDFRQWESLTEVTGTGSWEELTVSTLPANAAFFRLSYPAVAVDF